MAATNEGNILEGLISHLNSQGFTDPIAWPNVEYEPVNGTAFLKADQLPAQTFAAALGNDAQNRHTGLFQVSVYVPQNEGAINAQDKAGNVILAFKKGTVISYNGLNIVITSPPFILPMQIEDSWVQLPVRIPYESCTANG